MIDPTLTGLDLARARMAERRAAGEIIVRKTPTERASARPTSLRLAVTAKCWECQGEDSDPGVRARVRDCASPRCPLYPVRPWQNTKGSAHYTDEDEESEQSEDVDGGEA